MMPGPSSEFDGGLVRIRSEATTLRTVLAPSKLSNRIVRYFRANPGIAFIITFELLLVGIVVELWKGDNGSADEIGVIAFILVCIGVLLQTINSARHHAEVSQ
jgi:hypothetical protein